MDVGDCLTFIVILDTSEHIYGLSLSKTVTTRLSKPEESKDYLE